MLYTQRRFKFGVFCALIALFATVYPIRNATEQLNNSQAKADANEAASGSNDAQKLISAGEFHTCAVTTTGGVKCWGRGDSGQLGNSSLGTSATPVDVTGMTSGVTSVTSGYAHSCGLLSSGSVKCWGYNYYGQLGDGLTTNQQTPVEVSGLSGVQAISAGAYHTCALLTSGAVKCWGSNSAGTLGDGTKAQRLTPVDVLSSGTAASSPVVLTGVVAISSGQRHTCALMTTNGVKCWGQNTNAFPSTVGILSDGTTTERLNPVDVLASGTAASNPVALSNVVAVSAGGNSTPSGHTCVLLGSGGVSCWGRDNLGQLGNDESLVDSAYPVSVSGFSSSGASAISSGNAHSCLITSSGAARCWGSGGVGQLGNGSQADARTPVTVRTSPTDSSPLSGVSAITTGGEHSCALLSSGKIHCWGRNASYQIGRTTGAVYPEPVEISGSFLFGVTDTTAPAFSSASVNGPGTELTLTYSESLSATTAIGSDFSVLVGGVARSVSGLSVSGSTVVLSLSTLVTAGESVTVSYTQPAGSNAVQDSSGNKASSLSATSVTNNSTVDQTVPTFVSASTNSDGTTITLTYSEALSATTASASAFSVVVGGAARSVSSAVVSGSTVVLTLSSAVGAGQAVTVAYSDPSGSNDANAVQDSAGNDAATLSATSVTNNVPQPSSGGSAPTNVTTTSTSSTSTTTTIAIGPVAGTTTSMAPRRPRSTTTTAVNRTTTSVRATTTTTVRATTTTTVRATTTTPTISLPAITTSSTTTTSSSSTTTTSIAQTAINAVAPSAIQTLQQAEEKLKTVEAQTTAATKDLRAAQIQVGESRVAVLDPKSALVVAVNSAEAKVASLSAAKASTAEIAAAVTQLEDLKIAIAKSVTISIEKIAAAQANLASVLSDPSASAKQVAEAKAELVSARVPTVEVVAAILNSLTTDAHLAPVVIPGIVDNAGSGQIVLLDGSLEKNIEIVRINGNVIQMTSTDGFRLNISTRDKDGQPLQFNSRGGIVVKHGNFISISGEGFAPGTLAKTWLFSSPRELGNLNVGTDGSFAADLPITDDIPVGFHVAQVDGLSPDGEVRSLSLDVEILPSEGPAEYDPIAKRLAVAALIAQAMALLALSKRREDGEGDDDREQADVSEVSVDQVVGVNGTKRDLYAPPVIRSIDRLLQQIPSQIASTQQLLARIIRDGVYLRALTGVGGVAVAFSGVMVGFFAANSAGFEAMSPSFGWLLALVIVGSIDALAGGMAALTIIAVTAISGGINSTDAIRGLLGLAVLSFAIPLVASTTRPFRRVSTNSGNWLWTRASDVVLLALFGAWAAGAMYDALPGLYGFTSSAAGRTTTVQVVALTTMIVRFMLESVATKVTGNRLAFLAGPSLPEPSAGRSVFAILVRTGIMLFVAEAFIGNNIALWIGAAMYAIPKLVALIAHRFPKSSTLKIWLPAGLLRTVVMLFVARWWASNISSFSEDPETQLQAAFVLLGIPSLVLTSLGWFAGGERKWRSTPISKVLGIVVLVIGVLTVRGVLFA